MKGYNNITCMSCDFQMALYHDLIEECENCGGEVVITPFDQITDAERILDILEGELESANYHREMDLVYPLYNGLKQSDNDAHTARKIAEIMYDYI